MSKYPKAKFAKSTHRIIAERSHFRCAFGNCGILTYGPSDDGPTSVARLGEAAHIVDSVQGPNAKRKDPKMAVKDRKSAKNGIWLCPTHHTLVDGDGTRFPIAKLRKWKELARIRGQVLVDHGDRIGRDDAKVRDALWNLGLVEGQVDVNSGTSPNEPIGFALRDSWAADIWGDSLVQSIRDALIELTLNAFEYGQATKVTLRIDSRRLLLEDDGALFDPLSLAGTGGGSRTLAHLLDTHGNNVCSHMSVKVSETRFSWQL